MDIKSLKERRQQVEGEFSALDKERQELELRHPQLMEALIKIKAQHELLTEQIEGLEKPKSTQKADTIDATEVDKDGSK